MRCASFLETGDALGKFWYENNLDQAGWTVTRYPKHLRRLTLCSSMWRLSRY